MASATYLFPSALPLETYVDVFVDGVWQTPDDQYFLNIVSGAYEIVFPTAPSPTAIVGTVFDPSVNASRNAYELSPAADGTTTVFNIVSGFPSSPYIDVYANGKYQSPITDYELDLVSGNWTVTFTTAPASGVTLWSVFTSQFGSGSVTGVSASSSVRGLTLNSSGGSSPIVSLGYQTGDTPTVAVGAGAGTGASAVLQSGSTDVSGYIGVSTGTTPTASATIATVTFSAAYGAAPKVVFSPANAVTAGVPVFIPIAGTTSFALTSTTALAASTGYVWAYSVSQ